MTSTKADLNLILRELERQYSGDGEMARRIRLRIATAASRGSRRGRSAERYPGILTVAIAALIAMACISAGDVARTLPLDGALHGVLGTR